MKKDVQLHGNKFENEKMELSKHIEDLEDFYLKDVEKSQEKVDTSFQVLVTYMTEFLKELDEHSSKCKKVNSLYDNIDDEEDSEDSEED